MSGVALPSTDFIASNRSFFCKNRLLLLGESGFLALLFLLTCFVALGCIKSFVELSSVSHVERLFSCTVWLLSQLAPWLVFFLVVLLVLLPVTFCQFLAGSLSHTTQSQP